MRKRYQYPTRQGAEDAARFNGNVAYMAEVCLAEVASGAASVKWYRKGDYKVGHFCRYARFHDGYIVQTFRPEHDTEGGMAQVFSFETWQGNVSRAYELSPGNDDNIALAAILAKIQADRAAQVTRCEEEEVLA